MTDPTLSYQSASLTPSPLRTGVWNSVVALGLLYCLGALCIGGCFAFALMPHHGPTISLGAMAEAITAFFGAAGSGAIYLWAGIAIRRHVRTGAVAALDVALINIVIVAVVGLMTIYASADVLSTLIFSAMFGCVAIANAIVAWLLRRLLQREHGSRGVE